MFLQRLVFSLYNNPAHPTIPGSDSIFGTMKKFALIGCGAVAVHHAENILRTGELMAVCDNVPEIADAFANTYGTTAYYAIDDLLAGEKDIEAVVICTPNGFHAEHIIKSLQAKKHVLCESPLCLTTAAAWQIIETEKFCRRRLIVVNATFQHSFFQKLKTKLTYENVGEIYSFQLSCLLPFSEDYFSGWRGKNFPGGGLLYTTFSQYIEALVQLFGEILNVQGFKRNAAHHDNIEAEDSGTLALQMQNGSLGTLHWSANAAEGSQGINLTIVAENGTIHTFGKSLMTMQYCEGKAPLNSPERMEVPLFSHYPTDCLKELYDKLLNALDGNDTSLAGAFEGLKTVEAIEKIYKSISLA